MSMQHKQFRRIFKQSDLCKCIAEVKFKASKFPKPEYVEALDGVFKSDHIVPEQLKQELKKAAAPLEDVLEKDKDWHPGSNDQVLDLVHPSIYPLVYGQSRILRDDIVGTKDCMRRCGEGRILPCDEYFGNRWSSKYQWLPTEFSIPEGSDDVKYVRRCSYSMLSHRSPF